MRSQKHRRLALKSLVGTLVALSVSCRGSGPDVVLVPAMPGTQEPIRLAEPVKAKAMIVLSDGTVTVSKKRVTFPAGSYLFMYDDPSDARAPEAGRVEESSVMVSPPPTASPDDDAEKKSPTSWIVTLGTILAVAVGGFLKKKYGTE